MSFFGNTDNAKKEVVVRKPLAIRAVSKTETKEFKEQFERIKNLEKKILLPPNIVLDLDFYNQLLHSGDGTENLFLGKLDIQSLNYAKFVSYELFLNLNNSYYEVGKNIIYNHEHGYSSEYEDRLNSFEPKIFMNNVNLKWKILQLAKNDKSIKIPPNAPPLPSPPKRSSPKKSKSKLTKEGLEDAKSKLKPKGPPYPPHLPETKLRVRKPLQSPRKSSSKSKLTKEELEIAKSKLKPKGPPYPPPLPSPPKRSSPKKSKSKLTKEGLEDAKSKLKHSQKNLKPDDPNYYLEMAFRNLEK
jgi:hypothetical protein